MKLSLKRLGTLLGFVLFLGQMTACKTEELIATVDVTAQTGGSVSTPNKTFTCEHQFSFITVDPVEIWGQLISCKIPFVVDSSATLVAHPDHGFIFAGWEGDFCNDSLNTTCGFTVPEIGANEFIDIKARFIEDVEIVGNQHRLHLPPSPFGTVVADKGDWDCSGTNGCVAWFDPGTVVDLSAVPNEYANFGQWLGVCGFFPFLINTCSVTMDESIVGSAHFNIDPEYDIDEIEFIDPNMQACWNEVMEELSIDFLEDPTLLADVSRVSILHCSSSDITTVEPVPGKKGLEILFNLSSLNLANNNIDQIDLDGLIALENLNLGFNNLSSVDVSDNPELNSLDISGNPISGSLDLSSSSELYSLKAQLTGISTVILGDKPHLSRVDLFGSQVESIDLANKSNLAIVNLTHNNLSTIDLTGNTRLSFLVLTGNELTTIDLTGLDSLGYVSLDENPLDSATIEYLQQYSLDNPDTNVIF
ncbi:MAG: hypothetical protein MI976_27570 [Pseudomonadales bacterium]|nr:hypothetical protein [Pseudomonadales bacterium]